MIKIVTSYQGHFKPPAGFSEDTSRTDEKLINYLESMSTVNPLPNEQFEYYINEIPDEATDWQVILNDLGFEVILYVVNGKIRRSDR